MLELHVPPGVGECAALFKTSFTFEQLTGGVVNGKPTTPVNVLSETDKRVTVVLDDAGIYAVYLVCTHLGCTPNYVTDVTTGSGVSPPLRRRAESARRGSAAQRLGMSMSRQPLLHRFDELLGPAPRPMDWVNIEVTPDGFFAVDRATLVATRGPGNNKRHNGACWSAPRRAMARLSGSNEEAGKANEGSLSMSATPGEANPVRAFVAQLWGSVFRHGLPTNDKVAARTALTNFFLRIHPVRVKKSAVRVSYTLCLGGLSFFLFILLTITGLFLMFYYIPSVDTAYQNVKDLQFVAVFGDIIRNMHRWAAHAMVITVWLHMARVFYQGAYKPPREFNWVIGTFLLLITLLLSFSGYLLPWDQLAIWAITVGTNMAKYAPIVGPYTRYLLLGGDQVAQGALIRFYVLHVIALPLIGFLLMVVHFWRVRKDGFTGGL